jgi:hypothetical protein
MNTQALQRLRGVAENAPDDLLHMRLYREKAACGTAYCLLGWASLDPWFNERGLVSADRDDRFWLALECIRPILDISPDDCDNLFATEILDDTGPHAISKQEVLDNIDRVIAGGRALRYRAVGAAL